MFALSFLLLGTPLFAQKDQRGRQPKTVNYKRLESEHFYLFFTTEFSRDARELVAEGDAFLTRLAGRWSVILPEEKISISLTRGRNKNPPPSHLHAPSWLNVNYDAAHGRVEILVSQPSKFTIDQVRPLLQHALVHALLGRPGVDRPPLFLEEGLARHYAGDRGSRDRFLTILALQRFDTILPFLKDDRWKDNHSTFLYAGALGRYFVAYLWAENSGGEQVFLHGLLTNKSWKQALGSAGFRDWESLVADFEMSARKRHRMVTLLYTFDFWVIVGGLVLLAWMAVRVRKAWLFARLDFVEIEQSVGIEVLPEELKGPAFGMDKEEAPFSPTSASIAAQPPASPQRPKIKPPPRILPPPRPAQATTAPSAPLTAPGPNPVSAPPTVHRPHPPPPPGSNRETVVLHSGIKRGPIAPPPKPGAAKDTRLEPGRVPDTFKEALDGMEGDFEDAFRQMANPEEVEIIEEEVEITEEVERFFDQVTPQVKKKESADLVVVDDDRLPGPVAQAPAAKDTSDYVVVDDDCISDPVAPAAIDASDYVEEDDDRFSTLEVEPDPDPPAIKM